MDLIAFLVRPGHLLGGPINTRIAGRIKRNGTGGECQTTRHFIQHMFGGRLSILFQQFHALNDSLRHIELHNCFTVAGRRDGAT